MEPAGERPDDESLMTLAGWRDLPQWSRPVNGRTTRIRLRTPWATSSPQWSRPVNGRTTWVPEIAEPDGSPRPQWSRPVNGRTTQDSVTLQDPYNPPQWSRPVNGRTTPVDGRASAGHQLRRNGAGR